MTRRTSNAEHFEALVAHPYGLAAVAFLIERHRRLRWGHHAAGQRRMSAAHLRAAQDLIAIGTELEDARRKARGYT